MARSLRQRLFLPSGVSLVLSLICLCQPLPASANSVAVIGAGVHGLLAALELKLRGWEVTVYEKEDVILPIIPSIKLNGINYEYYSQAIFSPATFEGTGPNPSLARFAERYSQALPQPFAASGRSLYYDTTLRHVPYPPVLDPYFASPIGPEALAEQLAEAVVLLQGVGTNASIPADVVEAGIADYNETIVQWAQRTDLTAFADLAQTWWYAAESALLQPMPASIRLNMDLASSAGLFRSFFLSLGLSPTQLDRLGVSQFVQDEGTAPTAFQYLPEGVRGLLQAAIIAEDLDRHILFNTPVTSVTNEGAVTSTQGSLHYDAVVVTVRPEAAFAMLQPPLQQVYEGGKTGLVEPWIFNASIAAGSPSAANLSDVFLAVVSQNSTLPPRDGTPTFIIKEDPTLPFYAVAAYVDNTITPAQSLARAKAVLLDFGLDVQSTTATQRISFPSQLAQPADIVNHDHVYLLGEALAGIGLDVALPYVAAQMDTWFGPLV